MNKSPPERLRIVLAETDPQMRDFFLVCLKHLNHDVVDVVTDSESLLRICQYQSPDLVICALTLDDGDGIEAAKKVHDQRLIPFILSIAWLNPELLGPTTSQFGVTCFIPPIEIGNLKDTIAASLKGVAFLPPSPSH